MEVMEIHITDGGHRSSVAQGCDWNATVVGSNPTRRNELLFFNIFRRTLRGRTWPTFDRVVILG